MAMQFVHAATVLEAADQVPWAQVIVKSERGWIAFSSLAEFHDFRDGKFDSEISTQPELI